MIPLPRALFAFALAAPLAVADLAPTGTLRATFIGNNPVQGRVDAKTGAVTGPCPDIVREFGRRSGIPVVVTPLADANRVLESVVAGKADIGCLAIEAARATQVDFSDPYLLSGSAYAVRADSPIKTSADVDRAGVTVGAVSSQSQGVWVHENLKAARVHALPVVPPNSELATLLTSRTVDAFAANRTRMEELAAAFPGIRVLSDNFMSVGQAIVVPKGNRARLAEVNRLLSEVRASGFVKASIDRAGISGVDVAPAPTR
jgi:polar amino acid transport system substrate-binding protein